MTIALCHITTQQTQLYSKTKKLHLRMAKDTCIGKSASKPTIQGKDELFPEDIEQTIVPTHIARFINTAVNAVNIDEIISKYKGGGTSAYDPRLLLKAWLLGFVYKSYSSRGLARLMKENLAFKWISGGEEMRLSHIKQLSS